jgi:hypothetical protein
MSKINIFGVVEKEYNIRFNKNAKTYIKTQVETAFKKGIIDKKDKDTATKALISTGIEWAKKYGNDVVEPDDIEKNWHIVKMGVGNCPPNECIFKTVVSRLEDFGEDVPTFKDLHYRF